MRDPKRIKEILSAFEEVWAQNPDLRFYQLVMNIARCSKTFDRNDDPFFFEDDAFLECIEDVKNVLDKDYKND